MKRCFLYIISHVNSDDQFLGPVKIGIADNPQTRLAALQTGNPSKLEVAFSFCVPSRLLATEFERAFHQLYKDQNLMGEWFDMHPADAMRIVVCNFESYFRSMKFTKAERDSARLMVGITELADHGLLPFDFEKYYDQKAMQ